ncbi:MAG: tetratricopeptide repeat protein [Nitrospirae bacterium]|nr:tetratricopeptide repeat protein [Nitrospirota bacterium]
MSSKIIAAVSISTLILFSGILNCQSVCWSAPTDEQHKQYDIRQDSYLEYMLGYEAEIDAKWDEALTHYSKALKIDPTSDYLKIQVSLMLVKLGRINEALPALEDVVRNHPDYLPALTLLGELYNSQKRVDDAIRIFEKIIKIKPEGIRSSVFLGVLYISKDEKDRALGIFEAILKRDPDNIMALYYLASILIEKKEYETAEGHLKKILAINPSFDSAYVNLGIISEAKSDNKAAEEFYKKALLINPHNLFIKERLSQLYVKEKSFDKAIGELEGISKELPSNIELHQRLGILYIQDKQYDKAISEFRIVLEAKPDDIPSRYYLSLILMELEKNSEALEELKKIISADPKNINAFLNIALIYSKQNRLNDSAKIYEEILSFEKGKPEIYSYLGNVYTQMKEYNKAEAALKDGLKLFNDNDDLNFTIAVLYEKIGRFDDMERHLKRTIEINPAHADALNYLGYSYADKGINLHVALEMIKKALELKPNSGYIIDSLGWVYFKLGRKEDALKYLNDAVDHVKDDPLLFEHLGDVYESAGNYAKAADSWRESLKFHGKEEGLKERVENKIKQLESKIRK